MLTEKQRNITYRVLGLTAIRQGGAEFKVEWALSLLETGLGSDNILILASLLAPLDEFETDHYFRLVLDELNIQDMSREQAIEGYAKVLSQEVANGSIKPETAIDQLARINSTLDYPAEYQATNLLEDEWYCTHILGWTAERRTEEIVKACEQLSLTLHFPPLEQS